jgi:hypothetical protein
VVVEEVMIYDAILFVGHGVEIIQCLTHLKVCKTIKRLFCVYLEGCIPGKYALSDYPFPSRENIHF